MKAITIIILAMLPKFYISPDMDYITQYYLVTREDQWSPRIVGLISGDSDIHINWRYDIDDSVWTNGRDTDLKNQYTLSNGIILLEKIRNNKYIATDGYYWNPKVIEADKEMKAGMNIDYDYITWMRAKDTLIKEPDSLLYLETVIK